MPKLYSFEVHTPYRLFYRGSVEAITLALIDGEAGVYADHAPFTAPVAPCVLKIKDDKGQWKNAFVSEGIIEVKDHKTVLLADAAEWPGEIDRDRALAAKKRAGEILQTGTFKFETAAAQATLKRAEVRLKVQALGNKGNANSLE